MNVRRFQTSNHRTSTRRSAALRTVASVRVLFIALIALAGLTSTHAQNAAPASVAPRIAFEKYALPNGLEVILHQDRRLPIVTVNIWYHVARPMRAPDAPGSRTCSST
jgi:zinc protease